MTFFGVKTDSPDETAKLAEVVQTFFKPGDVIILSGELAAGKTHFVKSLVSAVGSEASVSSPTYTIAHHYKTDKFPILHIDAYRLSGADEFRDLTLDDFYNQSLLLIEWGDVIDDAFPEFLRIEFQFSGESDTARHIRFSYQGEKWKSSFSEILKALKEGGS